MLLLLPLLLLLLRILLLILLLLLLPLLPPRLSMWPRRVYQHPRLLLLPLPPGIHNGRSAVGVPERLGRVGRSAVGVPERLGRVAPSDRYSKEPSEAAVSRETFSPPEGFQ